MATAHRTQQRRSAKASPGVRLQDLPALVRARVAAYPSAAEILAKPRERGAQKYGNHKVEDNGARFDSKAEHRRWVYLAMLEKAGDIVNLQRQVQFELIPAQVTPSGRKVRATVYLADFVYRDKRSGMQIVEDVKGAVTPEYRIKAKLMLHVHNIEVQEVRS